MERTYVTTIFIVLFFPFCFVSCFDSLLPYQSVKWALGWEYRFLTEEELVHFSPGIEDLSLEYEPYSIPYVSLEKTGPKYLSARIRFRESMGYKEPSLLLHGLINFFDVYCGEQKLQSQFFYSVNDTGHSNQKLKINYNRSFVPIIFLPKECLGNYVYIVFFSEGILPIGFSEPPLLGDPTEHHKAIANRSQSFASLGFFFLVLGLFSFYLFERRKKKQLLAFTWFSSISGIHFLSQSGFFGLFYYDSIFPSFIIFILTLFLIPISCLYFFEQLVGGGRWNFIRMLWQFHVLFSVVILGLAFIETISMSLAILTFVWLCLPTLVIQIIVAWGQVVARKPKAILLVIGTSALFVLNAHDILSSLGFLHSVPRESHWGFFIFVVCLTLYGENLFRNSEVKYGTLQKEIVTAARIQSAILPPSVPNWEQMEISVHYQPSHEVGGDFYDFQALGSKRFGVLIADVVGHGLGASIIASLSKFAFFQAYRHWANPSFLLSAMNEYLVKKSFGRFTTATYFFIDFESHKFIVSSAGHPSFFHWKAEAKELVEIKPKGKPLGILPGLTYVEEEYTFQKGDQFLFYTDGLTEEENADRLEYGEKRLAKSFLETIAKQSLDSMANILADFHYFTGLSQAPHDDITIIYLHVKE
ncbi:serine/threonine-protein phosphatase [Leptospira sp. 2 VSF19]|uniref:Serine/threonine-protein phosphatase n=1 Tax=Leptospira soteropolitanensis TaxID=2950025 RepID=A0AAW5VNT1_9LEPT|nr:SpoIIE family protein phosphatase [Leptospira soteropolitanensis]MCW7493728.1 serine/threonine-protein phosphatase [Leptospira soteropolitanensis]MCW7501326.1 serine/threonine-protein phosphatase [Leptospira soteropolitanensis]MCW7523488.1 serine/threonine-protein phosphatase [Leptospira soteropolitanensis]MCW7527440.1 serine/threonine-protein phosphatase [Leptospira soteropolitanensis]MCW7531296.1 serine/threonine-protein phosphatase [Leptospira soteropolitanensis]